MSGNGASSQYQYVIVGSGVAGSTLAVKLLEHDPTTSILILEAGPQVPMKDRRFWWDYVLNRGHKPYDHCEDRNGDNPSFDHEGRPNPDAHGWHSKGSRTIMYGGSTVHWGGWSMRFKPEDFHLRSNTGRGGDWPYGYDTLEPYYCRAEEYLSVSDGSVLDPEGNWHDDPWRSKPAPMPHYPWTEWDSEMADAMRRLGLSAGHMPIARYRKCMSTGSCKYCPFGARFSASLIMDELLAEPSYVNLDYIGLAPATRLVASSPTRVAAVEYIDPLSGEATLAEGETIIVCSGAYEAPKLLQASISGYWPRGIGNDNDLVGRYAISHPFISVAGTKRDNKERWVQEYDFPSLMSRSYDTLENQANGKIFMMKAAMPSFDIAQQMINGRTRDQIDHDLRSQRTVQLSAFMEEFGEYQNRFTIGPGTGRYGLPRTRIEFQQPDDFNERANRNLDKMAAIITAMGYEIPTGKYPGRQIGPQDGHHTSSTCRMGVDESDGVVDADLKVFGTDNVYICSNAAHPTCAAVNPTLTLVAVTLKLTDHLLGITS